MVDCKFIAGVVTVMWMWKGDGYKKSMAASICKISFIYIKIY